jgi:hypothetical protein
MSSKTTSGANKMSSKTTPGVNKMFGFWLFVIIMTFVSTILGLILTYDDNPKERTTIENMYASDYFMTSFSLIFGIIMLCVLFQYRNKNPLYSKLYMSYTVAWVILYAMSLDFLVSSRSIVGPVDMPMLTKLPGFSA